MDLTPPDELRQARSRFQMLYDEGAPWDIPEPQPAICQLVQAQKIRGRVLDPGCGTGENALYLARQGLDVVAFDFVESAVQQARSKAYRRATEHAGVGRFPEFRTFDALQLSEWSDRFETVVDSGVYHVFPPELRSRYVEGLAHVLQPHGVLFVLCFSDWQPGNEGPLRIAEADLRRDFPAPWRILSLSRTLYRFRQTARGPQSVTGDQQSAGAHAWLAEIERSDDSPARKSPGH
jgi:SAM-dependent methyltransferase